MPRIRARNQRAVRDLGRSDRDGAEEQGPPSKLTPDRPSRFDVLLRTLARVRARGPAEVASLIAGRVREGLRSDDALVIFRRPLRGAVADLVLEGLQLVEATGADGVRYARDIGTETAATFRRRLSATTSCWVVERDDHIVHASWTTTSGAWTREIRRILHPPTGAAYVYESFTVPEARGHGIYPFALDGIAAALATRGSSDLWVAVEADNPASIRAVTKGGFTEIGRVEYSRTLGRLTIHGRPGVLAALSGGGNHQSNP